MAVFFAYRIRADCFCVCTDRDAKFAKQKRSNGAGGNAADSFPAGRTPAAAVVAETVFFCKGVIRMTGTEELGNISVIAGTLILVAYKKRDGSTCCLSLEDAGQDFDRISLVSLGCKSALTWSSAVKELLDLFLAKCKTGRTSVYYNTDSGAVGFLPRCYAKYFSK